jgi:aspartate-semialdehyde dehydrogenase
MKREVDVVVAGATGMVGRKMIQVLEERSFPVGRLIPLASARSTGTEVGFRGASLNVAELTDETLRRAGAPIALFSAGASVSKRFAPVAAAAGTLVIDNSSAFRMDPEVPLVVPEVNPADIDLHRGIIANPNCSTIQMVVALKPLHDRYRIKRIVVATYQSVTGAGQRGYRQLMDELSGTGNTGDETARKFPHRIAFNCLPHIDEFYDDGYTREEHKMMDETRKIMGDPAILVNATCVRVPVIGGHSEAVTVEFEWPFDLADVRSLLAGAPGVVVRDDPRAREYPMPVDAHDTDAVYVGRIRRDPTVENGLSLWIVSDNLRKGAATNAVQIAEAWLARANPTS